MSSQAASSTTHSWAGWGPTCSPDSSAAVDQLAFAVDGDDTYDGGDDVDTVDYGSPRRPSSSTSRPPRTKPPARRSALTNSSRSRTQSGAAAMIGFSATAPR